MAGTRLKSSQRIVFSYESILGGFFCLFGLSFGSFLNVCIHRLPRRIMLLDERDELLRSQADASRIEHVNQQLRALLISRTRSRCPHCKQGIAWYDNIPVLSWLLLRGRCRACRGPISPRYIAVELLTGALFVACYFGFDDIWVAARFCALSFFLVGLVFTDAEWKLLPDALTLPGLAVGLISSIFVPVRDLTLRALVPAARVSTGLAGPQTHASWRLLSLAQSALGAFAGAAFIYGAGVLYMRMRSDLRERGQAAMGLGDVKLMAMIGAFLGLTLTVVTMFVASITGSLFGVFVVLRVWLKRRQREHLRTAPPGHAWQSALVAFRHFQVPFGVFLGSAALFAAFFGDALVRWYAGLFG